jgi:hypothetical protein
MTTSSPSRLRLRLRTSSLASVPLLVLGLAACSPSSSGADSASGSGAKSDSQVAGDALAWDVANAQCMRGEGIDVPDPSSDGTSRGLKVGDGVDMDALGRASEKCTAEVTADLGPRPVTASEKEAQQESAAEARKTNECLREKGFAVSDPVAGGSGVSTGLENVPDDALEACGVSGGGAGVTVER